jgi:signal transduction histidine kinase
MKNPSILVVEDHEPLRIAIEAILEAEGWSVLLAGDGLEGLEVMSQVRPDLILADIMMPRMDGWAFYSAVRARTEWVTIPFIFLTAKTSRQDILKGMEVGAEDYITKPFEPEALVVAVRARLKRAEALRAVTEAELARLKQQIIAIPRQLLEAHEAERRSIARELHDEIGQLLTGLRFALDLAERELPATHTGNLVQAQALVSELLARVRAMSLQLRPPMLDDLGVLPTLMWYFERFTTLTQVRVLHKHLGIADRRFPPEIETAVYRIVQEALTNVARYAQVNEVSVRLWVAQEILGLEIEDCGVGFDASAVLALYSSSGISGMRERAFLLGGQFTAQSAPGEGTRILVELPLNGQARSMEE